MVRAVALILTLAACGSVRGAEPIVGAFRSSDLTVQRGRGVFDTHCFKCHARGEGGLGPSLNDKPMPRFYMRTQIRAGLGAMPPFDDAQLSDAQLEELLDYIVALRRQG